MQEWRIQPASYVKFEQEATNHQETNTEQETLQYNKKIQVKMSNYHKYTIPGQKRQGMV